jgi:glucokinase
MLLTIDIGGTHTRCAVFKNQARRTYAFYKVYKSRAYPDLETILQDYLKGVEGTVTLAMIGVPGPVAEGQGIATNLAWIIRGEELRKKFSLHSVTLLNDLEALGYAIGILEDKDLAIIHQGKYRTSGNIALVAPGTGLGQAFLTRNNGFDQVHASEGGHADFAPTNTSEIRMLSYLMARYGHVSYERICSGPGIANIYRFLKESGEFEEPEWLAEKTGKANDPVPLILQYATSDHPEPICRRAIEIFISVLAAECGNLALKFNAIKGVYIGGGIAPRILDLLQGDIFQKSFLHKGRFSRYLSDIPVGVISKPDAALFGMADFAANRLNWKL